MKFAVTRSFSVRRAARITTVLSLPLPFLLAACGGSSSLSNPESPNAVATAAARIVDVGGRYELSGASSTDPSGREDQFSFTWSIVNPGANTRFDDHCADDFAEICTSNVDDRCRDVPDTLCTTNADCGEFDECKLGSGTSSDQCTTGRCAIGDGDTNESATFVADVPGPFEVRMVVQTDAASDIDTIILDTYPSLYVVGSLLAFGGTGGAFLGELTDAAVFAAGASAGASNPLNGDLLLIDSSIGVLRRFDLRSGEVLGAFGESDAQVDSPVALAFDQDGDLYVAQADGVVKVFDGETGLLISSLSGIGSDVVAIAISPLSGDLLVADAVPAAGIRAYGLDGTSKGVLGSTSTAADRIVDFAFYGDPVEALFIADRSGTVIYCAPDGTSCAEFAGLASLLGAAGPSAIAVNPSAVDTSAQILIADPSDSGRVIACDESGTTCTTFGETGDGGAGGAFSSSFKDIFFAPPVMPTSTTVTTTTSSTTTTTVP